MEDVATIEKQAMIIAAGGRPRDFGFFRNSEFRNSNSEFREFQFGIPNSEF